MGALVVVVLLLTLGGHFLVGSWLGLGTQPLRADAQTLYLADWSQDLDGWSGGAQWHWQERGVISSEDDRAAPFNAPSNLFVPHLLAPYRPSEANIQVDAQIKVLGYGFRDETIFGILVGSDGQGIGYGCGLNWGRAIQLWPQDSANGLTGYRTGNAGADFSDYVTLTVTIRNRVMTLFIGGQMAAQATAPGYQAGGFVGVYATNGAVEVRSFRVDKLV
jgi:hypothetical protein